MTEVTRGEPPSAVLPRSGELVRHHDVSGVSGTGPIADVVILRNGSIIVGWLGDYPSTAVWPSIDSVLAVHGHHGSTVIVWSDGEVQGRRGPALEDASCNGR